MTKNLKNLAILLLVVGVAFPATSLVTKGKKELIDARIASVLENEASRLDEKTRAEVALTVGELARTYRIDPMLILAVMKVESTFNPKAISNAKAYGLMQVRSIVVKDVATELGILPSESGKLLSCHKFNIRVGVHYLAKLLNNFGGDLNKALMAYNAGPTTVGRLYKNRPVPNGGYQGKVLRTYRSLSNG
jgi:soluble lytic murein transglycosylase-like protein